VKRVKKLYKLNGLHDGLIL